jgi:AcrR family transcriptional regulator
VSPRPQIDHIRRPQILEAASRVIAERGIAATRIADIAERAGTSGPAILYWFGSKDELLAEALTFAEEAFYERLRARLERLEHPRDRLRLLIEASADDYDWTLWMELWTRALRDEASADARLRLDQRWRKAIADEVREGQARSEFAADADPEEVATVLSALLDGLAVQVTLGDRSVPPARMRELTLEIAERLLGTELPPIDEHTESGRYTVPAGGEES